MAGSSQRIGRHDLLTRAIGRRPTEEVALAEPEPASMHQEVPNRDFPCHPRVPHLKPRKKAYHRIVPVELVLLHQQGQRRGGERLRVRGDSESGVLVHGVRPVDLAHSVPAREDDPAVLHDRDGEAGHLERVHHLGHEAVEPGWGSDRGLLGARGARRARGKQGSEQGKEAARDRDSHGINSWCARPVARPRRIGPGSRGSARPSASPARARRRRRGP